ncbi:MAG TPA: ABC transporter permease [Lacunisphaera sp.]|nr:ABC transporter permease [Lacunisphaera sp.]
MSDLKIALRQLGKSPGFTVVAVLTLALGIGLSASSFSMANAFLLRTLPYPDSGHLVRIFRTSAQSQSLGHSPANLLDIRATAASFSGIEIYNNDSFALGEPGRPAEQVSGLTTTAGFFDLIGIKPVLGRAFLPGEDQPDKPAVALICHRTWVRRYGSDPGVLGRTVRLNTKPYAIVGVLPENFDAPLVWGPTEFVVPRYLEPHFHTERANPWMNAVARLQPGLSVSQAQGELTTLAARLARAYPKENGSDGLRVVRLHDSNLDGVTRSLLWLMTALSLTMLLIACANLASLQVARAFGRSREFAIRSALGGGRRQLMTPLLLESILLAIAGGAFGLLVASWSNAIIGSLLRINNEPGFAIPLDWRVVLFDGCSALLSGLAFGLAPAWLSARAPAAESLKEGSRAATGSPSHLRLKRGLIIAELALALALVGIAAAFGVGARTFVNRDVGWDIDGLYGGYIAMPYNRYTDDAKTRDFHRALLARLESMPGASHVVLTTGLPVYELGRANRIVIEGQPPQLAGHEPTAATAAISPGYFAALRIPLQQGAIFSPNLKETDPPVAIINEAFARRFWPDGSAVGRRLRLADADTWIEIIGVVGDTRMTVRFDTPETPLQLFRPLVQVPSHYVAIVVRTPLAPASLDRPVREAVAALDGDLPVARGGYLRAELESDLANLNLVVVNLGISAGMGLLIAGVGLFGVVSQLTAQRTRDIGVRMALGATAGSIQRMILGEGARMLAVGLIAGIPLFWALSVVLRRGLPEMRLPGLWLLATTMIVLGGVALLACWLPARRATRINPVDALRAE